jgi:hypothetical protein
MRTRRRILRSSAILAASVIGLLPNGAAEAESSDLSKKLRESVLSRPDLKPGFGPTTAESQVKTEPTPQNGVDRYPWRNNIVTTTFWVGEEPTKNNPVPNHASSWDMKWGVNYGGTDHPEKAKRVNYMPADFVLGRTHSTSRSPTTT